MGLKLEDYRINHHTHIDQCMEFVVLSNFLSYLRNKVYCMSPYQKNYYYFLSAYKKTVLLQIQNQYKNQRIIKRRLKLNLILQKLLSSDIICLMHSLRFDDLSIYITEKVMEYCGKFSAKSKKRVKWQIQYNGQKHQIHCSISFTSGKKKVVHNGFVVQQIKDSSKALNAIINVGDHKMIIMIDENSELIRPKIQMRSNLQKKNEFRAFIKFKNIYCG